jgi:hypothetical protein
VSNLHGAGESRTVAWLGQRQSKDPLLHPRLSQPLWAKPATLI